MLPAGSQLEGIGRRPLYKHSWAVVRVMFCKGAHSYKSAKEADSRRLDRGDSGVGLSNILSLYISCIGVSPSIISSKARRHASRCGGSGGIFPLHYLQ